MVAAAMMSDRMTGRQWRGFKNKAQAADSKATREKNTVLLRRFGQGEINVLVATSGMP